MAQTAPPRRLLGRLFALTFCLLAAALPLSAQTNQSTVTGTVTDPAGALVKDARVTLTNVATNETREATTSEDGVYSIPNVDPGTYRAEITAAGFKNVVVQELVVQSSSRVPFDAQLEVGTTGGEVVNVTSASQPLVESESSVRGDTITGREVVDLPIPQRNFTLLATLSPGVTRPAVGVLGGGGNFTNGGPGESTESTRFRESGGSVLAVNGARVTQNNFMLDGVDNNETQFGQIAIFPDPDAIAEFKIDTSVPPAESGRAGGAVINTTIKSGGNDIHGTLYEFYQGAFASARPTNNPNPGNFVQHNFGGTVGGPIFLPRPGEGTPHFYDGRNRSFFFVAYNQQRGSRPIPEFGFVTVPTARMRAGDFGELLTGGTQTFTRANGTTFTAPVGTVFCANGAPAPANNINNCGQPLSAAGRALLNAYPLPTQGGLQNNYARNRKFVFDQEAYTVRIDHNVNDSNSLFGRYSDSKLGRARQNNFPLGAAPNGLDLPSGFGAGNEFGNTRQLALGDTHTFTPTVVNDLRAGYSRVQIGIFNTGVFGEGGFSPTVGNELGIANSNLDANTSGIPLIGVAEIGSVNQLEFVGDGGPFYFTSNNYYVGDAVTVVKGNQTLKFGGDLRVRQNTQFDAGRIGRVKGEYQYGTSAGGFLSGNYAGIGPEDSGSAIANILLGYAPAFAQRGAQNYQFLRSNKEIAFFVQDDWKASPTLTLNLGLRYDIYTSPTERFDVQYNFDPATRQLVRGTDASPFGRDLAETDMNNFAPRFGFAWSGLREDRSMVVRGGYGIVYTPDVSGQLPLAANASTSANYACGLRDFGTAACPQLTTAASLDTGLPVPGVNAALPQTFTPAANQRIFYVDPNAETSYYHQYNLTYQWEFAQDYLADFAYVGSLGRNLLRVQNIGTSLGSGPGSREVAGFNEIVTTRFNGSSRFDAFQAKLERRFARGFSLLSTYTWAHGIDDTPGGFPGQSQGPNDYGPKNPLRPDLDRGNSDLDVRHRFTLASVLDLPFGRGRRYWSDVPRGLDYLIGGWQLNNIVTVQSGPVYTVRIAGRRPDLIGDPTPTADQRARGLEFNPDAFTFPRTPIFPGDAPCTAPGDIDRCFGNLGRNTFRGQRQEYWDASLFKNIPVPAISEAFNVQLRVQAFNVMNHINRFVPNRDINFSINSEGRRNYNDQNVGRDTSLQNPRQLEFSIKLIF